MYAYKNIVKRIREEPRIKNIVESLEKEFSYSLN
jgi:hypothetical protein